jgi:hypothetical protein
MLKDIQTFKRVRTGDDAGVDKTITANRCKKSASISLVTPSADRLHAVGQVFSSLPVRYLIGSI